MEEEDEERKKKKPFVERMGDWVCIKCKNLNFSFRVVCNRCQLPKPENEKMFENYMGNLMNCAKVKEMMQQRVMNMPGPQYGANNLGYVNNNSISINNNYYSPFPQAKVQAPSNNFGQFGSMGNMGSNFYNTGMGMGNMSMNSYMGSFPYGMEAMQENRGYFNDEA